ncbi:histone-lysine N-methyltransferase 2B-like [Hemicordylus capensis]|uniref:histone-lysine N-methyltransferase 2B-like n=1 Tax=Hemicordylus capensis TaxID=884348 RepID=UPI002304C163|nr:histone-lysine N-methyltransferase 2B-like [Hemicordylus capensis]
MGGYWARLRCQEGEAAKLPEDPEKDQTGVPENPSPVPPPPPPTHRPQSLPPHPTSPLCSSLPLPVSPSLPLLLMEETSPPVRSHPIPDLSTDLSTVLVLPQKTPSTASSFSTQATVAIDLLSDLQVQYTEKQKRIKRLSEIFMASLGTLHWQVIYTKRRIEAAEERLWRERAAGHLQQSSDGDAGSPAADDDACSSSSPQPLPGPVSLPSLSPTSSPTPLHLHPLLTPPPSPPLLDPDRHNLHEVLEAMMAIQIHELRESEKDLASIKEAQSTVKGLRRQLTKLRSRLCSVEEKVDIRVRKSQLDRGRGGGEGGGGGDGLDQES